MTVGTTQETLVPGTLAAAQVFVHLFALLGKSPDCTGCKTKCCGVPRPPAGARIRVTQPLTVCHDSSHHGLDGENRIPPGDYVVIRVNTGTTSHFMQMKHLSPDGSSVGDEIHFNAGYAHESLIDWRTCQRIP